MDNTHTRKKIENRKKRNPTKKNPKYQEQKSTHSKPSHTNHNIQPLLLTTRILKRPHPIAVNIPERPGRGMQPTLARIPGLPVSGGGLVDKTLLHDGAVHGEAVGSGC